MELDPKIKVKKIFDVFSYFEEVKKYYGKEVYCADFIENISVDLMIANLPMMAKILTSSLIDF